MGVFQQKNHGMGDTPSSPTHTHTHTHTHTIGNPKKYIYFTLH